jgi:hypothetical protein
MKRGKKEESSESIADLHARKKVLKEMEDLRSQIKDLRKQKEMGKKVDQDIEACLGYLKVLKKEIDSIKESSHTTFLTAKSLISPKFNYGSKKEEILARIKKLATKIRSFEKQLTGGGLETEQKNLLNGRLEEVKDLHKNALLELKALENFNHTRFLQSLGEEGKSTKKILPVFTNKKKKNPASLPPVHPPEVHKNAFPEAPDYNPPPMI